MLGAAAVIRRARDSASRPSVGDTALRHANESRRGTLAAFIDARLLDGNAASGARLASVGSGADLASRTAVRAVAHVFASVGRPVAVLTGTATLRARNLRPTSERGRRRAAGRVGGAGANRALVTERTVFAALFGPGLVGNQHPRVFGLRDLVVLVADALREEGDRTAGGVVVEARHARAFDQAEGAVFGEHADLNRRRDRISGDAIR